MGSTTSRLILNAYTSRNTCRSSIISSNCELIEGSFYSGILFGYRNTICVGNNSSIISSCCSRIVGSCTPTISPIQFSTIISGYKHIIQPGLGDGSKFSVIVGGFSSSVSGSQCAGIIAGSLNGSVLSNASLILGGCRNCLCLSCYSTIAGGYRNTICSNNASIIGSICSSVCGSGCSNIVGGFRNTSTASNLSLMIGGQTNCIRSSTNSVIIGGCQNLISGTTNSTIIGAVGFTLTASNTVVVPNLTVCGNLIPALDQTFDLGATPSNRWRDLWLSGNTIYLGDARISSTGSSVNIQSTINATTYQVNGIKAIDGPAFSAYGSVATSLPSGVGTKIQLDSEEFDTDNAFNTSTSRFQPTLPGFYQFNGHFSVVTYANSTSTSQIMILYKNGNEYKRGVRIPVNTQGVGTQLTTMIFMDGIVDYVEMYGLQGSGATVSTEAGSAFGPWLQGNFVKPSANNYISIQYLVIGGGGGGGKNWGGGGGGGGFVEGTSGFIKGHTYTITVGTAGVGAVAVAGAGGNGGTSSISGGKITTSNTLTIVANGGGGGGYNVNASTATTGNSNGNASGGGAGYPGSGGTVAGGSGVNSPVIIDFSTVLFFNSGGQSRGINTFGCGGGGGAGAAGTEGQSSSGVAGGNGGAGKTSSISGTSSYYSAGGGGGGNNGTVQSSGGTGNTGGKGGNTTGGAGTAGAGGYGMGGGGGATNDGNGGNGTAGVVILSVLTTQLGTASGTYTTSTNGSYTVITFTGNGTYIP
jgi:hypothetical protein